MASFLTRIERLLADATAKGIVDARQSAGLLALAREGEKDRGALHLAAVLGWLGGGVLLVGLILIASANWDGIPDIVKLGGLLALLAGTHGTGLWIRWKDLPYGKTAEAFHLVGAGLFLGGIGLVAQIYHLDSRPPNGILLWLVAIAPLALLLRSAPITVLSIVAFLLWAHMEGEFEGSPLQMLRYDFTSHLMLEIGIGTALVGFSPLFRDREPSVARAMRICGALLLFYGLYALGFYRHFSRPNRYGYYDEMTGTALLPFLALGLGTIGLALGARRMAPDQPWFRNRLLVLLSAGVGVACAALASDIGVLPRGPEVTQFSFGWHERYDMAEWLVSASIWALWFLLALWCVGFGAKVGSKAYVNAGVLGVALGVLTRFFDLIGSLAETGTLFVTGGVLLIATAWAAERWRRKLVRQMPAT